MSIDVHYGSYGEILYIKYTPTIFKTAIRILIHGIILLIFVVIFMLQILYPRLMIYRGLIETVGFGIVICVIVVLLLLRIRNYASSGTSPGRSGAFGAAFKYTILSFSQAYS